MITPQFSCTQTDESVTVAMYCPSIRAGDVEIHVDQTLVSVHVNPYFLRLNFSYPLLEDDASSARYDPSSGYLAISLTKENKGQVFEDLDLLSKLLAPRPTRHEPLIEVVGGQEKESDGVTEDDQLASQVKDLSLDRDREREEILRAAENDWQLPQEIPQPPPSTSVQKHYGFLDMHSGYFTHVAHTENEVNELGSDAEICLPSERRRRRLQHEDQKFDPDYYMADYAEDENILELLHWKHPHVDNNEDPAYTEEEKLTMLRLPRKEYLSTQFQTHNLYLVLLTLLFSYTYDSRTTQHDPTPESAWTIASLTPAFSALDPPKSPAPPKADLSTFSPEELRDALIPSYRRSFAFPLYRSFILAEACRIDVAQLLSKGKRTVTRCLLEMKHILDHHEVYYVYSKIWVDDFCVWIQACASDDVLASLGEQLKELSIDKNSIGWDLVALEAATQGLEERESDSDDEESDDDSENSSPAPL